MKKLFNLIAIAAVAGFVLSSCANTEVELEAVSLNGKWGFANSVKEIVIPCEYDEVLGFSGGFAAVRNDGKWGFVNAKGETLKPCKYEAVQDFSEGLAVIKMYGKWGVINAKGDVVESCKYDNAGSFSNGFAKVEKDGLWGFINTKGKLAIPCLYDDALDFLEGKAKVKKGDIWGYVDKKGVDTFRGPAYEQELQKIAEEKRKAEEEERMRQEEERRRLGTDFVITLKAEFDKYGDLTNRYSNIGELSRFTNSFETKRYWVPEGKRLKYLYYENLSRKISKDKIIIEVYAQNGIPIASHNLAECGEFNVVAGQSLSVRTYNILPYHGANKNDCSFDVRCHFKEFEE